MTPGAGGRGVSGDLSMASKDDRLKITLNDEAKGVLIHWADRYGVPAPTLARVLLSQILLGGPGNSSGPPEGHHRTTGGPDGKTVNRSSSGPPEDLLGNGTESATRAQSSLSEINKREREEVGTSISLSVSLVAERVIGHMNKAKPRKDGARGWDPKVWEHKFKAIAKKGFTEDDMMTVVRRREQEARDKGDWQWFKPDTLFRSPQKFAEYLDNARACVYSPSEREQPRDDTTAFWNDGPKERTPDGRVPRGKVVLTAKELAQQSRGG